MTKRIFESDWEKNRYLAKRAIFLAAISALFSAISLTALIVSLTSTP